MYKNLWAVLFIIVIGYSFSGCSDDPASVGKDQIPVGDYIPLNIVNTDSLRQSSFTYSTKVPKSYSSIVSLGRNQQAESSILMKFDFSLLQDSIINYIKNNTLVVKSARIDMVPVYSVGEGEFRYKAYKVNSDWNINFDADSLVKIEPLDQEVSVPGTFTNSDTLYSFDLSTDLVREWLQNVADTILPKGIYLKHDIASNINRAVGFRAYSSFSSSNSSVNLNIIVGTPASETDTLTFDVLEDVHIVKSSSQNPFPDNDDYIYIQGGIAVSSFLKFDFPTIPENAVVNYATLEVTYDSLLSSFGKSDNAVDFIAVEYFLEDSANVVNHDSTLNNLSYLSKTGTNQFSGDITRFVQYWFSKNSPYPNKGLKLSFFKQIGTIDYLAIISGNNEQQQNYKPRIRITYSVP